ncbi:MAG: tRNA-dihydrouridine synthase family protein [Bacteroidales bacterium]|nr:tRNA-dihydrouridine synthase family protein [Bacteroidales bacterium]
MAAPLQGLTEAPFRHFHAALFPLGADEGVVYFTPFVRMEKGEPRSRDMRDIMSPLNSGINVIPQVIARDGDEFARLAEAVAACGYSNLNLNAGCPFPPQVHKGRGAGLLNNPGALEEICCRMTEIEGMHFSIKMRFGVDSVRDWMECADIINSMPVDHVTIHPRTACQQYSGDLYFDQLGDFIAKIHHPVIFNGEIYSTEDIVNIHTRYPDVKGIMVGRGLLRRPSLFVEYMSGEEWSDVKRRAHILSLHSSLCGYYSSHLCGDTQILTKLKPFWDYFGSSFPRKQLKVLLKSRTLSAYMSAAAVLAENIGY